MLGDAQRLLSRPPTRPRVRERIGNVAPTLGAQDRRSVPSPSVSAVEAEPGAASAAVAVLGAQRHALAFVRGAERLRQRFEHVPVQAEVGYVVRNRDVPLLVA